MNYRMTCISNTTGNFIHLHKQHVLSSHNMVLVIFISVSARNENMFITLSCNWPEHIPSVYWPALLPLPKGNMVYCTNIQ